jgi:hypothetical protein
MCATAKSDAHVRNGSRPCENSEMEFADRKLISTSSILKTKDAGNHCREKTTEKTILRLSRARTFSHSLGHKQPRRALNSAAAIPPITDTKADGLRVRYGQPAQPVDATLGASW